MHVEIAAITDKGLVRERNEDSIRTFRVESDMGEICCFIVADGVGGHQAGGTASHLAVTELERYFRCETVSEERIAEEVFRAFHKINSIIYDRSKQSDALNGMGTTLTAAFVSSKKIVIGHVGDSRAYLFRDKKLSYLTNDHSLVGELMASGSLSREEARFHPRRNIITRAMGLEPEVEVEMWEGMIVPGDFLLLCSDGLTDLVSEEEIASALSQIEVLSQEVADHFIDLVVSRGAHDNVSIVLAHWPEKRGGLR